MTYTFQIPLCLLCGKWIGTGRDKVEGHLQCSRQEMCMEAVEIERINVTFWRQA